MSTGTTRLKDIAEKAGVSIATVSRVLRGRGEISEPTRKRILKIAKDMRYRPNRLSQGLLLGRTETIGVLFPQLLEFDARILVGVQKEISIRKYALMTTLLPDETQRNTETAIEQIHQLIERRVDGIIMRPMVLWSELCTKELLEEGIPIVTVDSDLMIDRTDFVGTNDELGARIATEHLIELGHKQITHVAGPNTMRTGRLRREVFKRIVSKNNSIHFSIVEDKSFGIDYECSLQSGFAALQQTPRPTAIFAANDYIANGVFQAARQLGLRIPEDLSVIGFADMEFAERMDPPLTTMQQSPTEIGEWAVRFLFKRIEGRVKDDKLQQARLKPKLILRKSTAAPAR